MGATEMINRFKSSRSRSVAAQSDDYAIREYGVTEQELDRFVKRMKTRIARDRRAGTITLYTGDLEADLAD
jgi:hypothetical protein